MCNIDFKEAKCLKRQRFFPIKKKKNPAYKYEALISLGANIAPEEFRFKQLFRKFLSDRRIKINQSSFLLINEAFGYKEQKDFTNALVFLQSSLHARELLKLLQHYENIFKRKRTFKNAPRTLDLDIIFFSKKSYKDSRLCLPHIGAYDRTFITLLLGLM
ncbi:2-amino-4-hydroxy-6-hydroxymethyldihydropteridine diphosphokinase [Campylobacter canadensis]|uniref:2-amino-4-hydroxy-6-hydroxymethyldihydropteridine pyrophosphokinase n=1 Tax=Campylobacter canadensis TaxID=449520 RepID=A0ABS7WUJ3_9BACT|nr:2-amino-4-hydroxy-6-hydroxymethyldihydropteridine diphosphokinase [Campylobacter canadensis]MBZ7988056.1 2-amino-4-hydroxy-6-hydroxymethyldihydropteridine diphosphokinase [Campylobacter canadensis]MBZ7995489.1 2-amino-4-hydroxy-6-hydroxymethyldihydropteridine diphosphokinase [Campylobacter canadensis]MBZ7997293.1 2-amino-4-hydroxy-6-hydroxymethyldihydropteridine diphosphokinase [Campylobacter canadensis]MBZ7999019.1 2-amino-4-hydroxy-6-hydroxymethyldihydropteridine diphosphokinase [Campyloba